MIKLQYNFAILCENLQILCRVVSEILDLWHPAELEIKDTTESITSASYLNLPLSIGRDGKLHTSIYDKRAKSRKYRWIFEEHSPVK